MLPATPRRSITVLACVLLLTAPAAAQVKLEGAPSALELAGSMRMLQAEQRLSWQEALSRYRTGDMSPVAQDYPGFGFVQKPVWFALGLDNHTDIDEWFLETATPFTDRVEFFLVDSGGELLRHYRSGDRIPYAARPLDHPHIVFPFELGSSENATVLLRVETENALDMPASLYSPAGFRHHEARRSLASGCYFGIVAIMCLYNLLIFISIRDISYLYYVGYLGLFGLTIFTRHGLAMQWLWPEAAWWNHHSQPVLTLLTLGLSVLFASSFLGLRSTYPRLYRGLVALGVATVAAAPVSLIDFPLGVRVAGAIFLPWTLALVVLAAVRSIEGFASARYFLIAFASVAVTVALFGLRTFEIIEGSRLLEDLLPVTTALEALLLSFALAHRMTALKRENEIIHRRSRAELESRVEERTRELNEALAARSQFLATISHEVRTPLNGILGNVDLVREEGINARQARHLRIIEQSGETLLQLINDILDFSRIEAGKMTLEREPFDLSELASDCVALFERDADRNNTRLALSLDGNLGRHAFGDALRVRQVLANLISNAVKFTRDGQIHVSVHREEDNAGYVVFEVRDTGMGIAEDQQEQLFEHFHQLDSSTSRRYGGSGLGLAICKQLVEIMGGEIGVFSRPGDGSRFWFRIPLPQSEAAVADEDDAVAESEDQAPARLLVVDDNHVNLMVAEGLCRRLGHKVTTAESGTEALATLINEPRGFDLVLMDCEMPNMDGFETTRRIRKLQSEGRVGAVPVVALTAHAVPDKIRACRDAGMEDHIAKPVNLQQLARAIRRALSGTSRATADPRKRQAD